MSEDEKISEISKILAAWSPVSNDQAPAIDLSDYEVEAQDILWATKLHGYSAKRAVSEVLQQAFLIELDKAELDRYSSGGKTKFVGLSKKVGNRKLRSVLIQGALAYVYRMKAPRTGKDVWLKDLIERAGPRRAAVALANKNVRTAWALVTQGTEYQRQEQREKAA